MHASQMATIDYIGAGPSLQKSEPLEDYDSRAKLETLPNEVAAIFEWRVGYDGVEAFWRFLILHQEVHSTLGILASIIHKIGGEDIMAVSA